MRLTMVMFVVLISATVINTIRGGMCFPLPFALPFMGGPGRLSLYNWSGVVLLLITAWGIVRLFGKR